MTNNPPAITKELLEQAGVTLSDAEMDSLLEHLNDTLDERVGTAITDELDDDQLKTLVELQDSGDIDAVGTWLLENVPELEAIYQDEIDILIGEFVEQSDKLDEVAE